MVLNGVSVVTTTWNERENVEKLVPSIRNVLQGLPHEIIVVVMVPRMGPFKSPTA